MEDFRKTGKEQYFENVCFNYVRQSLQKQDLLRQNLWWVEISPCPQDPSKDKKKYFEWSWLEMKYEEINFEGKNHSEISKKCNNLRLQTECCKRHKINADSKRIPKESSGDISASTKASKTRLWSKMEHIRNGTESRGQSPDQSFLL